MGLTGGHRMPFINRADAGIKLAKQCFNLNLTDVLIFALPRGGAIVGAEIAKQFNTGLSLIMVRKIAHPHNPEYAIGAVAEEKTIIKNEIESRLVSPDWLAVSISEALWANKRRRKLYFNDKEMSSVEGKTVLLVDDGIATGLTMMAAIKEMRTRKAKKIIVAVPICPIDVYWTLKELADDVICLIVDESYLGAVGAYYDDFRQVTDQEVIEVLKMFKE
jgi:putative phosphoribosyl transferase